MPQEVDASTKTGRESGAGGMAMVEPTKGALKVRPHQSISAANSCETGRERNGDAPGGNRQTKDLRECSFVRDERRTRQQ